jgi:hypothetical protein
MSSTLPPSPTYNPNVPVVTPAGGTALAYKDPNSPEAILRKTAALNAQARVDSQFDNATSAYASSGSDVKEGFCDGCYRWIAELTWRRFVLFVIGLFLLAAVLGKTKGSGSYALFFIVAVLILAKINHFYNRTTY